MHRFGAFLLLGLAVSLMASEEPAYEVLEKHETYEIRRYPGYLVAETTVNASFRRAGNSAFNLLFGYISGRNQQESVIESDGRMIERKRQKIDMTAPVLSSIETEDYVYQFVMPNRFTLASLPIPSDPRVTLREIPEHIVAVHRFKGCPNEESVTKHQDLLHKALQEKGLVIVGQWMLARYNAPYVPCFMRRNEVMVGISKNS